MKIKPLSKSIGIGRRLASAIKSADAFGHPVSL